MSTELKSLLAEFKTERLLSFFNTNPFFALDQNPLAGYDRDDFSSFEELGEYKLEDNNRILVVVAMTGKVLNERSSRKLQYEISKKILTDKPQYHAGLFVYHDATGNFRLSLVYKDFEGTRVKLSIYRRFSYFVEKDKENKTFKDRLGTLDFKNLAELKELFSVDKVTKIFFNTYREQFFVIVDEFENNAEFRKEIIGKHGVQTSDFVKKLMGQIVFLYFLQRKGWLGVRPGAKWGTGDQHFVRTLFQLCKEQKKNFYNDYLEPLFYDCLGNPDRGNRGATNDQSFAPQFNARVPYLNGGLFEDEYDFKSARIEIKNETFEKLLDFFDQYNFTVDENTPSDQEVSIDPEMLGKIFENLLDVKDRRDRGAYYTPREIVHYMCRESLVNYLLSNSDIPEQRIRDLFETKDTELFVLVDDKKVQKIQEHADLKKIAEKVDLLLRDIKIVDPAVGSGAFPMGMLSEISSTRWYLYKNFLQSKYPKPVYLYDIKRETLENCIYGVDIDPGAVEIAKLRFWLALVVEHEIDDVEALPNLDYKIMQGNSLVEEFEGVKLFDEKLLQAQIIDSSIFDPVNKEISKLQSQLLKFYTPNPQWIQKGEHKDKPQNVIALEIQLQKILKQNKKIDANSSEQKDLFTEVIKSKYIRDELEHLHKTFFGETNRENKREIKRSIENLQWELIETTLKEQNKLSALEKLEEFKRSSTKPFFLWRLNFSEVFEERGGFDVVIANPPYVSVEKFARTALQAEWKRKFKTYAARGDIYCLFYEQGLTLLRDGGALTFISSNKFQRAGYGKGLRQLLTSQRILTLIDFCELPVFAASTDPMIVVVSKAAATIQDEFPVLVIKDEAEFGSLRQSVVSHGSRYRPDQLKADGWSLEGVYGLELVDKLRAKGTALEDYVSGRFYYGIKTGLNEAFVIDRAIRDRLISEDQKSAELIKPWIRGKDIKKWFYALNDLHIIQIESSENVSHSWSGKGEREALEILKKTYPAVAKHLLNFETELRKRTDQGAYFWELRSCDYWDAFAEPKIVYNETSKRLHAYLDDEGNTINKTGFIILTPEAPFVLAVLNSKPMDWLYRSTFPSWGDPWSSGRIQFRGDRMSKVPIPAASSTDKSRLTKLAERASTLAKSGDTAGLAVVEEEIDAIVCKLFDLTADEIEQIETSLASTRGVSSVDESSDDDE